MIAPVRFSCLLYGPYRIPLQEKTPPDIGGAGQVIGDDAEPVGVVLCVFPSLRHVSDGQSSAK